MPSGASPRATMVSATRVCAAIASFGAAACHAPSFSSAALAYLPTGTWCTSPTAIEPSPASLARSRFGPIATLSSLESFGAISTSWLPSRFPKPDGRQRPLAVAALEDKIVQRATAAVLNAIYEEDFLGF